MILDFGLDIGDASRRHLDSGKEIWNKNQGLVSIEVRGGRGGGDSLGRSGSGWLTRE